MLGLYLTQKTKKIAENYLLALAVESLSLSVYLLLLFFNKGEEHNESLIQLFSLLAGLDWMQ